MESVWNFDSGRQLLQLCAQYDLAISEVMLAREKSCFEQIDPIARMQSLLAVMKEAVEQSLTAPGKSMGGCIGGEAKRMYATLDSGGALFGPLASKAIAYAMGVIEVNARMGLIVAAPTAGSSGVLPAGVAVHRRTIDGRAVYRRRRRLSRHPQRNGIGRAGWLSGGGRNRLRHGRVSPHRAEGRQSRTGALGRLPRLYQPDGPDLRPRVRTR